MTYALVKNMFGKDYNIWIVAGYDGKYLFGCRWEYGDTSQKWSGSQGKLIINIDDVLFI